MDSPLLALVPPAFILFLGCLMAGAVMLLDQTAAGKEPAAVKVNYDLVATCDDLPDFDSAQTYCPACLARWHEFNAAGMYGLIPAGNPVLCDDHARRLTKACGLDPRAIAHGSVAWLLYGIRPQGETR